MLRMIASGLRALFRTEREDRELEEEVTNFLEMAADEKVKEGLSRRAAAREVRLERGSVQLATETVYSAGWRSSVETFRQDVRFGARTLRKHFAFSSLAVFALALGIAASSVMFSAVDAILLRPLPYRSADGLVVILTHGRGPVAPANYLDWKGQSRSFDSMGAAEFWTPDLTGVDRPTKLWALHISPDILPMLGIAPLLGRSFSKDEEQAGHEYEVVLSHGLWQRQFAGDPDVLGRQISLDGKPYTVVGVMPRGFKFAPFWATKAELWAPLALGTRATDRGGSSLRLFARLAPGVRLEEARSEMAAITARLEREYPGTNRDAQVIPLKEKVVGTVRPALLTLLLAVGFVLLIACANVAHMLLARGAARGGEVAVRSALGAGRARLVRQFLTESLLLATAGGVLGLLLAFVGIRALVAFGPADLPRLESLTLDWRVTLFTFGVSLATGAAFGLAPAWQSSRFDPATSLKEAGRSTGQGTPKHRLRGLLVVTEFALALMLLIGAGLMLRTLLALQAIDPGFDPRNVLTMVVSISGSQASAPGRDGQFYSQLLDQVRAVPGIRSAGLTNHLPLAGDIWGFPFWIEGQAVPDPGDEPTAAYRLAFPGYFETMGMQIVRGRAIENSDTATSLRVVVVNEYLAGRFWPNENPVGKHLTIENPTKAREKKPTWLTVIGVVKNAVRSDWAAPPEEEIFLPYSQNVAVGKYMTLVARTANDPAASASQVERAAWDVDRDVTISEVQAMTAVIGEANAQTRFNAALLAAFAVVALVLSGVGIYGVMTYVVTRRRHEIGIRMALGASRIHVLGGVLRQGMALALTGSTAGVVGGLLLSRLMTALLYGVKPVDPLIFGGATALLTVVALAACWVPARVATRVDPMVALRCD